MVGQKIVDNAKKYIGIPYVWGGESKSEGGFDCSGLIYNALKDSSIICVRDTSQGYYNKYKNNPGTINIPGALLFFGKSVSSISHVAIATGDGKHMIESIGTKSNTKKKPGKGVTLSLISRRKGLVAVCLAYKTQTVKENQPQHKIDLLGFYNIKIPTPVLKRGCRGREVEYLQKCLVINNPNCNIHADGIFGEKTFKAVKSFQSANPGCGAIDGIYGKHTRDVLAKLMEG